MTDLKTVLVEALKASALHDHTELDRTPYVVEMAEIHCYGEALTIGSGENASREWGCGFDADRLVTTIRDHFSKVYIVAHGEVVYGVFHREADAQAFTAPLEAADPEDCRWLWNISEAVVEGLAGEVSK